MSETFPRWAVNQAPFKIVTKVSWACAMNYNKERMYKNRGDNVK
jgi:hypothetical protein